MLSVTLKSYRIAYVDCFYVALVAMRSQPAYRAVRGSLYHATLPTMLALFDFLACAHSLND
eukprot:UN12789